MANLNLLAVLSDLTEPSHNDVTGVTVKNLPNR
jgi:hypothetical protein